METQSSGVMKNLVLFIIGLAILGIILALAIQFTGVLPVEPAILQAPMNAYPTSVNSQITDAVT